MKMETNRTGFYNSQETLKSSVHSTSTEILKPSFCKLTLVIHSFLKTLLKGWMWSFYKVLESVKNPVNQITWIGKEGSGIHLRVSTFTLTSETGPAVYAGKEGNLDLPQQIDSSPHPWHSEQVQAFSLAPHSPRLPCSKLDISNAAPVLLD